MNLNNPQICRYKRQGARFSGVIWIILSLSFLTSCQFFDNLPPQPSAVSTSLPTPIPTSAPTNTATFPSPSETPILETGTLSPTPEPTPAPPSLNEYASAEGAVTIHVPDGGRYIMIGDSLGYGSQFLGNNTFDDMCVDRWPFSEQLTTETGILTTANLDRGHSIRSPFLVQTVRGRRVEYCNPGPEDPILNTLVPGSNTMDWLEELRYHPVVQQELSNPANTVVLMLIGADIFAEKIDKPPVNIDEYTQNLGKLIAYFATFDKVTYVSHFPHVRIGSFIKSNELQSTNDLIDEINLRIDEMVALNGYLDTETAEFVEFGQQIIEQDGMRLWINYAQPGPNLDELSDTFPDNYYAKDGLHYHADAYNAIGSAWAAALKAPIEVIQAEWLP